MTNNYKESIVTGNVTAWRRCFKVVCENPLVGIPSVSFHEEQKVTLPDGTTIDGICADPRNVSTAMTDPNAVITLLNPETGAVVGTTTYMQLYVMLFSLYRQLAAERDNANA